jgi:hypothetical protein
MQHNRMSNRQRVAFERVLPLVLAENDHIGVTRAGADAVNDIAGGLEPSGVE